MATLNHEKQALQARLSKLREAESGDLQVGVCGGWGGGTVPPPAFGGPTAAAVP